MKLSVIYHSKSGNTKAMAETIVLGMESVENIEAKAFSIDSVDEAWVKESKCVVIGSPTYMANTTATLKAWLETGALKCGLSGKIGGAFATADYIHGGGEMAIRTILDHMMCYGMLTYSAGGACGKPVIHLGPVAVKDSFDECKTTFRLYGERMATKAMEIFGE